MTPLEISFLAIGAFVLGFFLGALFHHKVTRHLWRDDGPRPEDMAP